MNLNQIDNVINLKNLIYLSQELDLNIFTNKKKIKKTQTIIKECLKKKNKEIKKTSSLLSNLAKINSSYDLNEIKTINHTLENKISNIDNFINCVNILENNGDINGKLNIELNIDDIIKTNDISSDYFECYSNC